MRSARQNRGLWVPAAALLILLATGGKYRADPSPEPGPIALDKAEKAVKDRLKTLKGDHGTVTLVKDDAVNKLLPTYRFYTVLFRQFPVGRVPPAMLKTSNVFAVDGAGKVHTYSDTKALEKFFKERLTAVDSDDTMKQAARAWVRLSSELSNDGFYKFKLNDKATAVAKNKMGNKVATSQVVVMQGGSGLISAQLVFGKKGSLEKVTQDPKVKPGPRPICQATKLLDKDPIVRKMAEQDLLIMGRAAKTYLDEQKAKASPALKKAIEAMWKRICAEEE